jgi:CBS domain containing-hemolysin-like protein
MMTIILLVLTMLFSLVSAAFCSGMETAFLSVSRGRILHLAREGSHKAKIVQKAISDLSTTTTTLLIGTNLASVTYSAASAALILATCKGSLVQSCASFLAALLILWAGEFMPKLLCAARPLRRVLTFALTYHVVDIILRPLTILGVAFTNFFIPKKDVKEKLTSADLIRILNDRKDGVRLSDFESALIGRIIVLRVKGKPITPDAILDALRDFD